MTEKIISNVYGILNTRSLFTHHHLHDIGDKKYVYIFYTFISPVFLQVGQNSILQVANSEEAKNAQRKYIDNSFIKLRDFIDRIPFPEETVVLHFIQDLTLYVSAWDRNDNLVKDFTYKVAKTFHEHSPTVYIPFSTQDLALRSFIDTFMDVEDTDDPQGWHDLLGFSLYQQTYYRYAIGLYLLHNLNHRIYIMFRDPHSTLPNTLYDFDYLNRNEWVRSKKMFWRYDYIFYRNVAGHITSYTHDNSISPLLAGAFGMTQPFNSTQDKIIDLMLQVVLSTHKDVIQSITDLFKRGVVANIGVVKIDTFSEKLAKLTEIEFVYGIDERLFFRDQLIELINQEEFMFTNYFYHPTDIIRKFDIHSSEVDSILKIKSVFSKYKLTSNIEQCSFDYMRKCWNILFNFQEPYLYTFINTINIDKMSLLMYPHYSQHFLEYLFNQKYAGVEYLPTTKEDIEIYYKN